MSEIKQKRLQILLKLFGDQIKQRIETETLNISEKELLNKFSDYEITESGKYLEWMTKTYIGNGFLYEDLYKVKETLEIFHENKMKLSKDKRDIQQYRTLVDLWIEVKKFVEQKDDFLSTNEQKRKEKELAYSETKFLYEDDNLRIIVPLTENSSKWWGKGTRWCTAADKNNMFLDYFKEAPLLIFDFKDGTKWQLWMNENNIQFMDEDDYEITDEKIIEKWNLISDIFMKLLKINGLLIKIIPYELRTKKLCEISINKNGIMLYCVPNELRTKELCKIAIKQNYKSLQYIPDRLKTKEICELAVKQNGLALEYVVIKNKELCEIAIKQNGWALQYVPENLRTQELYKLAIQNNGTALFYVQKELKTMELCKLAVQQNGLALFDIPKELRTKELCEIAVKQNGESLEYVLPKLRTKKLCEIAIKQNIYILNYVPNKFKTKELCEIAVKQNGYALKYVPKNLRTQELYELAIQSNGNALELIPEEFITKELSEFSVRQNGMSLSVVPLKLRTEELCKIAVEQNGKAIAFVPENLKTQELYELIKNNTFIENNLEQYVETFSELMQKENKI